MGKALTKEEFIKELKKRRIHLSYGINSNSPVGVSVSMNSPSDSETFWRKYPQLINKISREEWEAN